MRQNQEIPKLASFCLKNSKFIWLSSRKALSLHYNLHNKVNLRLMIEENIAEIEIIGEEIGILVTEDRVRDIDVLLEDLTFLRGSGFINQLKEITNHPAFFPAKNETNIFITGGERAEDYDNLMNAARKAVEHGYRVFILPNPKGVRTADYIFERKGVLKMYDLKTISGQNSVDNRLSESIGQTNRVLLHMCVDYSPSSLARSIKHYFESNPDAKEALVFKGKKLLSVTRKSLEDSRFFQTFIRRYTK